jgi:diadenosine tetraphosphate (Ap4A) HIT family hydrolase
MIHATMLRFGYPKTLIADYEHWAVLLRPEQVTVGSLVMTSKSDATRFSELPEAAFAELERVTKDVEYALARALNFDKINYLMLMMSDPHVHFHVFPRYSSPRGVGDATFNDAAWPKAPDSSRTLPMNDQQLSALRSLLESHWRDN